MGSQNDKIGNFGAVLDKDEYLDFLVELLNTPSYTGLSKQEHAVATKLHDKFKKDGIDSFLQEVYPGRPNVVGILDGGLPGPNIVFNAHIDTIPPANDEQGKFSAKIYDERIYGLGAVDDKGPACAMALSLVVLKRLDIKFKGKIIFAGVVDEEYGNGGSKKLVETYSNIDYAIIGEPTGLNIAVAHKGIEWINVLVKGKSVHSSVPEFGINAISKMIKLISLVQQDLIPCVSKHSHPLLGPSLLNLGLIKGGTQPNQIASQCLLKIERRYNPDEILQQVYKEIQDIIEKCKASDPELSVIVSPDHYSQDNIKGPFSISPNHILVNGIKDITKKAGLKSEVIGVPYGTDAPIFAKANIPTLLFAPGEISEAHSANESMEIKEFRQGILAYSIIAANLGNYITK